MAQPEITAHARGTVTRPAPTSRRGLQGQHHVCQYVNGICDMPGPCPPPVTADEHDNREIDGG